MKSEYGIGLKPIFATILQASCKDRAVYECATRTLDIAEETVTRY